MFVVNKANRSDYYKYLARTNYECALAADDKVGFWPGYELAAPPPVMTLCAHSIELSFKAFLLDAGVTEKQVRALGHHLENLWTKCIEHGADPDMLHGGTLPVLSDLLVSGRLRYGEPSRLGMLPVFGPVEILCEAALNLCGAPLASDIIA